MTTIKILLRITKTTRGVYPIIMRVIKNRKVKTINLGFESSLKDWNKNSSRFKKSYPNYRKRNLILVNLEQKAHKIIDDFILDDNDFSLNQFEEKFRGKKSQIKTVSDFWIDKLEDLEKSGRMGTYRSYKYVYNSLFKFAKSQNLLFKEITVDFLNKYEIFMRESGSTDGGIGVRMRTLKAVYNDAIKKGLISQKHYPFSHYKTSKLKGRRIKKAIRRSDVRLIEELDLSDNPELRNAKNFFLFSYFCRGINFHDMMLLTCDNIQNDRLLYTRSKTKKNFNIKLEKPALEIINFYKTNNPNTKYIFPILLQDEMTAKQIENRKLKALKKFNNQIQQIAIMCDIEVKITSYTARHTFATNLKFLGISTDIVGEAMGHSDINVTNAYLKDFADDVLDEAVKKLIEEPQLQYAS